MSTEFDQYSKDYRRSIAHAVRSPLKSDGENEFLRAKGRWIDHWWTAAGRPPVARVLDYGCGTGLLTGYLHDLRPGWSYSGADPSAGMIDAARMRTASLVTRALQRFGFQVEARRYLHFFPPRLRALQSLERGLAWLPLGLQYLVEARLPEAPVALDVAR